MGILEKESSLKYIYSNIDNEPVLSKQEEQELFKQYNSCNSLEEKDKIKSKLFKANQKLVLYALKRFNFLSTEDMEDCIQEGYMALVKSIEDYSLEEGYSFSTFSMKYINNAIYAVTARNSVLYIPRNLQDAVATIKTFRVHFYKDNGREPTKEEIKSQASVPKNLWKTLEEFQDILWNFKADSLDKEYKSEDSKRGDSLESILEVDDGQCMDRKIELNCLRTELIPVLKRLLRDKEYEIISMRYGLDGRVFSQKEIAEYYGITSSRVQQLEKRAIGKLQRSTEVLSYKDYLY